MPDIEIARLVDRLMRRIHAAMNAKAPEFDRHRVGPQGGILLITLGEIEPAPIQTLVRSLARDKSQISRNVQALERRGLIERRLDPADARVSILALTDEGRKTVGELETAVAEALDDLLSPLPPSERQQLKTLLARIWTDQNGTLTSAVPLIASKSLSPRPS